MPARATLAGPGDGSALAAAAAAGQTEIVKFLVQEGKTDVSMALQTGYHGSALITAAARAQTEIVEFLPETSHSKT